MSIAVWSLPTAKRSVRFAGRGCSTPIFQENRRLLPIRRTAHGKPEEVNRSGILFVMTMLALLPAVICLLCDWRINGGIVWSGYAAGAIGLLYVLIVLPMWFRHPESGRLCAGGFCGNRAVSSVYRSGDEGRLVFVVCVSGHGGNRAAVNGGGGAGVLLSMRGICISSAARCCSRAVLRFSLSS